MTAALIGLGMMGAPMAACLAKKGFKPRVLDATPAAIETLLQSNDGVACSCILPTTFTSGFMLGLLAKNVKIAAELSEHLTMNTPLLSSEKDYWASAEKAIGFRADRTLVFKFVEQQQPSQS